MAGDTIAIAKAGTMMIHEPYMITIGDKERHEKSASELERVAQQTAEIYADRTGNGDLEYWRAAMAAETWYRADEAVAVGLADEVVGTTPQNTYTSGRIFNLSRCTHAAWYASAWAHLTPSPAIPYANAAAQLRADAADAQTVDDFVKSGLAKNEHEARALLQQARREQQAQR